MSLFKPGESLEDLEHSLMGEFDGQTLTVQEVFERHGYGLNYRVRDFQSAIRRLEADGWVQCSPNAGSRPGETLALDTAVMLGCPLLWYQQKGQCLCLMAS
jgi:hypothetical protein